MDARSADPSPGSSRRYGRLWLGGAALGLLGLVLLGVRFWIGHARSADPCARVRICDPRAFEEACKGAQTHSDPESVMAVLGRPIEERCEEASTSCELEFLGGPGPLEDGCVVRYEKGSGRILEARWHSLRGRAEPKDH